MPARLLLAAAMALALNQLAAAETVVPRSIRVALAPEQRDTMSGIAWRAMMQECDAIWAREGVALTWSAGHGHADVVLPVVFDDREVRKHDPKGDTALGVTVFAGRSQRILISISGARRALDRRHGFADSRDGTTLDISLGVLLGRVIAHEIGHALLLTLRHSSDGLMRARYDDADLRPALGGQFALLRQERDRIAVRFSNAAAPGQVALADFTWRDAPSAPSLLRAPR